MAALQTQIQNCTREFRELQRSMMAQSCGQADLQFEPQIATATSGKLHMTGEFGKRVTSAEKTSDNPYSVNSPAVKLRDSRDLLVNNDGTLILKPAEEDTKADAR